ncbi:Ppx/GppA phosphatase family protein [Synechocystis sp. LKSZ1]|uniref:Ppx/GppA phosphatase family protein n=1 Tax=Synechocystis sp. LKSZ1 TaxID=3144951 RepID=UPI00336BB229
MAPTMAMPAKILDPCLLAAIDIGTNSVHMVIVRIDPVLSTFTIVAREKDTVRLGERVPQTNQLSPAAMERAIAALKRCKDLALSTAVDHIFAVATSATREASNGEAFLARIQAELDLTVHLISGQEEARRIYLGVLSGMDFQQTPHIIIDIGGGSTELILADSHEPRFLSSTKIGAVRLTRDFIYSDPIDPTEFATLRAYVRGMLERPVDELKTHLRPGETVKLVGTSGTIETLATIIALQKQREVPNPLQGYQITRKEIRDWVKRLAHLPYADRFTIPGISDRRAEIILAGSVILLEAMTLLNLETLTICERALREGVIVDWMLTHGLIEDRLRFQCEIRQRSVLKIAHKYRVDLAYGQRVAAFALSFFDQLQGILHHWGDAERQWLWAAAILHNCGIYISHSSHHKHSYYLIRHAELLGYTEIELELIANIARYHRRSKPKKRHEAYMMLSEIHRLAVRQLSAILRLAVALDRRQVGAIQSFECKYDGEYQALHLHLVPTQADDDCGLELWNLDYKKVVFEEEFGVKVIATLAIPVGSSVS